MKLAIFGASGFAREVADVALVDGYEEISYLDVSPGSGEYFGFPLFDEVHSDVLQSTGWSFVVGVGNNALRRKIYSKFPSLRYVNVTHPSASFGRRQKELLQSTRGNIITAGVRFTNNIRFGDFGIFNLNCTIGHDCMIEDFVNIAPGANVSGNVMLSTGSYVGTNASIIEGRTIDEKLVVGSSSTVGAGSVVTRAVPPDVIVKGVPAK